MEEENACRVKLINDLTVSIQGEGHTLMNPIRWAVSNNWSGEKVEFCGYNIPHPSDDIVQLSVQFEDESLQSPNNVLTKIKESIGHLEEYFEEIIHKIESA